MRIWIGFLDIFIYYFVVHYIIFACKSEITEIDISKGNISMDTLVYYLADNILSWNDYKNNAYEPRQRVRRSEFPIETEYVSVDCKLTCWIEAIKSGASGHDNKETRNILLCRHKYLSTIDLKENFISAVRVSCIAHKLGSLLHITISPNVTKSESEKDKANVNFLSEGFSIAVRSALMSMTPIPETLYMTLDIPIEGLRDGDLKYLSQWLRRLSLLLSDTGTIDKFILQDLSLDSFRAEGCDFAGLSIQDKEDVKRCRVEFLYSCPERDYIILVADKTTHSRHCKQQLPFSEITNLDSIQNEQPANCVYPYPPKESMNVGCKCEDVKAMLAAFTKNNKIKSNPCQSEQSIENLLYISLWINFILSMTSVGMISIVFFIFSYYRTRHRTAISVEPFENSQISKLF